MIAETAPEHFDPDYGLVGPDAATDGLPAYVALSVEDGGDH